MRAGHLLEMSRALAGVPLTVVFAEGEAIDAAHTSGGGSIRLEPPYHVADDDAYLVLPDDIGMEIVDIPFFLGGQ